MPIDLIRYNNFLIYYNTQGEVRSHTEWEGGGEGESPEAKTSWEEKKERLAIASVYPHLYRHTTCFHHASCLDVVLINQTLWSEFSVVKHFALSTYVNEMVLLLFPIPQDPSVLAKLRCLFSFFFVRLCLFWTGFMTNVYHDGDRLLVSASLAWTAAPGFAS